MVETLRTREDGPAASLTFNRGGERPSLAAGLPKRATCDTFPRSFATDLLEDGGDIRTIQELPGHKHVAATMIYTHVLNRGLAGTRSPADCVFGE